MKNIAITIDKKYAVHAAVMLFSLLSNNNPYNIYLHIILDFKSRFYRIPVMYVLKKMKCKYRFYYFNREELNALNHNLNINLHISTATYYRLFLPSILKDIDKVLFLDSDIIVDGSLDKLFTTNIEGHTLAAVRSDNEDIVKKLSLKDEYFNAGVMYMNLDHLRRNEYESRFLSFINKYPELITFWDQDVLNKVTEGTTISIDSKWNFLPNNDNVNTQPIIIHYAGTHKPWGGYSNHPLKEKYFLYLRKDWQLNFLDKIYTFYFKITSTLKRILCF